MFPRHPFPLPMPEPPPQDKPVLPPLFTLPHWINPSDEQSVRAFMESCALAWTECVKQRRLAGCCEECGIPIIDPSVGCANVEECPSAFLSLRRRMAGR